MGYKLSSNYRWYIAPKETPSLAKVYYIEGIPYEFDIVEENQKNDLTIIKEADSNKRLKSEDIFKKSDYLIAEMMHPLLFELEIENPEELPTDYAA